MATALFGAMVFLLAGALAYVTPHFLEARAELRRYSFGLLEQLKASTAGHKEALQKHNEAARAGTDLENEAWNEHRKQRGLNEQTLTAVNGIELKKQTTVSLFEKLVKEGVLDKDYEIIDDSKLTPEQRRVLPGVLDQWKTLAVESTFEASVKAQLAATKSALDQEESRSKILASSNEKAKNRKGRARAGATPVMSAATPATGPGLRPRANTAGGSPASVGQGAPVAAAPASVGQGAPVAAAPARPQTRAQARGPRRTS